MALPTHILLTYSYILLFAWILVEQFGIPLPATPILLAAGALSAEQQRMRTANHTVDAAGRGSLKG